MNKREVGQIIYILSQSDMNLIPVIVVEEMIRRTLEGEEITYEVEAVGRNGARKRFSLDEKTMKTFSSVSEARDQLVKNAVDAIEALCNDAASRAKAISDSIKKNKEERNINEKSPVQEYDEVLLEDGTRVKINLAQGL